MARKQDDYLDRVNQTLLEEDDEDEPVIPSHVSPKVRIRNTDHTDVDLERYAEELEDHDAPKALKVILILLLLGAVFVGLALWMKFGGGLPW